LVIVSVATARMVTAGSVGWVIRPPSSEHDPCESPKREHQANVEKLDGAD
jgi:hypothetical protein